MRNAWIGVAVLVGCLGLAPNAGAQQCPPWRPCGPGETWGGNRLIGQGFRGTDFRPACARHDACLAAGCSPRACDRAFLRDMNAACAYSTNPWACRRKACRYFLATRIAHLFRG
jgi:hypothetical protein